MTRPLYDRAEAALASVLGHAVFGFANTGDVIDAAREQAARRLAPWLGDAADGFVPMHGRAVAADARLGDEVFAHIATWSRMLDAEANYHAALGTCAELRARAVAAEEERDDALARLALSDEAVAEIAAERDKILATAMRRSGEVERMGRAIAAALRLLFEIESTEDRSFVANRVVGAVGALRSVAWAEPDAAEAEEHPWAGMRAASHEALQDEPAPVALTCAGAEACLRGEEVAALRRDVRERDEYAETLRAEVARVRALVPKIRATAETLGAIDADVLPKAAATMRTALDGLLADAARDGTVQR